MYGQGSILPAVAHIGILLLLSQVQQFTRPLPTEVPDCMLLQHITRCTFAFGRHCGIQGGCLKPFDRESWGTST